MATSETLARRSPARTAPRRKADLSVRARRAGLGTLAHSTLIVFALVMIYPLLWMVGASFKPETEVFRDPGLVPSAPTVSNYLNGWLSQGGFGRFFLTSIVICAVSVAGILLSCSFAAYAFARLDFSFKRPLFAVMLVSIMLPLHVTVVPQYIIFSRLGWVNTFWPLLLPKLLAVDSFFIFLLVQFIRGLPRDLDEAAKIDGCGPVMIFWRIILPLMKPALATAAIFAFIWSWNDFFIPLLYLTDPDLYTVPLALRSFVSAEGESAWGQLFAMSVLSLVPIFVVFLYGQRFLIRGIATTGLK
jgi:multiple sugar transport system permease protein